MNYRSMQISDYEDVIALWCESDGLSLRDADSPGGIEKYLQRNPGLSFVACDEGGIVGTLMAGHDGKRGYIQHLAVADRIRQNGVASRLLELCLEALKSQGILKSHVHVIGANEAGRRFWINRGWTHRSEIEMYSFINSDNINV